MSRRMLTVCIAVAGWLVSTCASGAVKVIRLPANDMVHDPHTDLLYVSVPSRAGALGNTVTSIDPARGAIVSSVFVGSEPGPLALSEDGRYLYVGLGGAAAVRRVDLPELKATLQFPLMNVGAPDLLYAHEIEVQPGHPEVIAVSLGAKHAYPSFRGVAIFERGKRRPKALESRDETQIEFSSDPGVLYGDGRRFYSMKVDAEGISILGESNTLFQYGPRDMTYVSGRLFVASGDVVDPTDRLLLGTFDCGRGLSVVAEPGRDRVLILTEEDIKTFQVSTFTPVESVLLPPEADGEPTGLVRWGTEGLAFRTRDQIIVVPPGALTAPSEPTTRTAAR